MNTFIDLGTRAIVQGHYECILWRFSILLRDRRDTLVMSANLMDTALPVKTLNGALYVASRKLLHHLFQFGVFLAHDLFELYGLHASILQLCKRTSSLNRFMLPTVTDEQHTIVRMRDSGMRNQKEVFRMRWEHLDWGNKRYFVYESKSPKGRRFVPISPRVRQALLARYSEQKEGWIFPSKRAEGGHLTTVA